VARVNLLLRAMVQPPKEDLLDSAGRVVFGTTLPAHRGRGCENSVSTTERPPTGNSYHRNVVTKDPARERSNR
jgi:hypothetical protein